MCITFVTLLHLVPQHLAPESQTYLERLDWRSIRAPSCGLRAMLRSVSRALRLEEDWHKDLGQGRSNAQFGFNLAF